MLTQLKLILDKLFRIWRERISPCSLALGQAFHCPPKPPFSLFAWVTTLSPARHAKTW